MRFLFCVILNISMCTVSAVYAYEASSMTDSENYRDSLYHHISREGIARLECRFTYPQGSAEIHRDLGDNALVLARLDSFIHAATHHPNMHIKRIRLTGYSSIEGTYAQNELLSYHRVENFYAYLRTYHSSLYRYPCDRAWVPEDWEGLTKMVRESNLIERYEILEIIRNAPVFDGRELLLMRLNGGRPYRVMAETMFPQLRRVEMEIEYDVTPGRFPVVAEVQQIEKQQEIPQDEMITVEVIPGGKRSSSQEKSGVEMSSFSDVGMRFPFTQTEQCTFERIFAIKTNLLNWAGVMYDGSYTAPLANLALEYYITDRWSAEIGAAYSYWNYKGDRKFQGLSGYRLEPRYRLTLPGDRFELYTGVYGRVGDYDLRRSETTGHTGTYWDAGLSSGVHLHITPAWGIEFGARAGYLSSRGKEYTVRDEKNYFDSRRSKDKFRVTDLNVSVVYRFR